MRQKFHMGEIWILKKIKLWRENYVATHFSQFSIGRENLFWTNWWVGQENVTVVIGQHYRCENHVTKQQLLFFLPRDFYVVELRCDFHDAELFTYIPASLSTHTGWNIFFIFSLPLIHSLNSPTLSVLLIFSPSSLLIQPQIFFFFLPTQQGKKLYIHIFSYLIFYYKFYFIINICFIFRF